MGKPGLLLTPLKRLLSTPFTPTDLSGLLLWFDCNDGATVTTLAGLITQWNDKSGHGNNLSQANPLKQFTYNATGLNSLPAATGTGTSGIFMSLNSIVATTRPTTLFAALSMSSSTNYNLFAPSGNASYFNVATGNLEWWDGTNFIDFAVSLSTNTAYVIHGTTNSTLTSCTFFVNGASQTSTGHTGSAFNNMSLTGLGGQNGFGGNNLKGAMGEIILYNSALSGSDQTKVVNYLRSKWSI